MRFFSEGAKGSKEEGRQTKEDFMASMEFHHETMDEKPDDYEPCDPNGQCDPDFYDCSTCKKLDQSTAKVPL